MHYILFIFTLTISSLFASDQREFLTYSNFNLAQADSYNDSLTSNDDKEKEESNLDFLPEIKVWVSTCLDFP